MDIAIIGLAGSGKTSLLKALAAGHLPQHGSPNEPLLAVVKVPDTRLDALATLVAAKKTTYLELRMLDFPALGASGKGPAAQLLGQLSTADLIVHVVRAYGDDANPARDVEAVELELMLSDLRVIERRIERLTAEMRSTPAGQRGVREQEMDLLKRIQEPLEAERPIRILGLEPEELAMLAGFNLLTAKPLLIVLNIDEADLPRAAEIEGDARGKLAGINSELIAVAARAEADVAELPPDEAAEFRKELGLPPEPVAERVLQSLVTLLGLITFYTAGPQDTHAWSIPSGTPAVKAAGRIHSDIERGFIRAEVLSWRELLDTGSHAEAKKRGVMRTEGKTYEVRDGDVINVLFNV
jgi:GTP-binding protein YchF